jgi:uncharacterized protein YyaL (SSP411 family)
VRSGTWTPPYPETTGYIIPTFYDVAELTGDESYRRRAEQMAAWLPGLQLDSGAFPIGPLWPDWERRPVVFDTGQILHGLVRAFEETRQDEYLRAAIRAGDWLCQIQEADGGWRRFTSTGGNHTYNVRTAWALVRLHQISEDEKHRQGAVRNLQWALSQQEPDGWYHYNEFRVGENPLTHTIAYTIEGILESGALLSDDGLIASATRAADALAERQEQQEYLRGRYGPGWQSTEPWSCLTGNAQMGLVWFRLYEMTGKEVYRRSATSANRHVKQRQSRTSSIPGVRGGVAGSWPLFQQYEPYRNLNWAAKFFADSLILEDRLNPSSDASPSSIHQ